MTRFFAFIAAWALFSVVFAGVFILLTAIPVALGASEGLYYVGGAVGVVAALIVVLNAAEERL